MWRLGILFSLCSSIAWAQSSTAGIVAGQVVDSQNLAISGAEVKIVDIATNTSFTTLTNNAGRYVFPQVTPGTYSIVFSKQKFAQFQVTGQEVLLGQLLTIDAKLEIGAISTTVTVGAPAGAELQTMNATVGNTVSGQSLMLLPNLSRDVQTFSVLQPGVNPSGFAAGTANDQNTYQLDGGNISDDLAGTTVAYQTSYAGLGGSQGGSIAAGVIPTPVESIEEFKVSTSNQTSDFNNSSGMQVQLVTKRGSNRYHGSLYMFYFDTTLGAANSWTNNHTPFSFGGESLPYTPIISNHRDRFGGTIGGPIAPKPFLGGKWYYFFNYEGLRFPNTGLYSGRSVPSLLMRAGVIQVPNSAGVYIPYNLNPGPVTVAGVTYAPAVCPAGSCDPRSLGLNPIVSKIWSTQLPLPNNPLGGDEFNTQGFLGTIRAPQTSNTYVGRIDHDFNDKWHWYGTYRDLRFVNLTTNQVDIGGVFPGDALGVPIAVAPRPQQPSFWATGLTTSITPTTTNTLVFNYTRNFWQWSSENAPPQLPGLGGAVEIGGEAAGLNALIPYNVNANSIKQRLWDGQDKLLRDDVTRLKGNHLLGFGGAYQRNFNYLSRTDNGNGVNDQIVYQVNSTGINFTNSPYIPATVPSSQLSNYESLYAEVLGIVNQPQVMYTRAGPQLSLQPVGTAATDKVVIPYYSVYFYDTWHVKPSLTVTYGLGWNLEMPPYELNGSQVELVDAGGNLIDTNSFIAQREKAALAGGAYTPQIGFELVRNVGSGLKYPYNPYYGEFSPRGSIAWNPHFSGGILGKVFGDGKTVLRGGYGRIFGRLNGVNLVLTPLLGPGLLQGVTCPGASSTGQCLGSGNVDPASAFRIGTDGLTAPLAPVSQTLPQPYIPGVGANPETVDPIALDPHFRPDRTDNFTLTLQREINSRMQLEAGYIGKIIRNEYVEENLDAVPYMTTLNGQSFAQAYSQLYQQMFFSGVSAANVSAQPFLEAALGGAGSAYCAGFTSCTAALASKNTSLIKQTAVSDLWAAMNKVSSWTLGRTMLDQAVAGNTVGQTTSIGMIDSNGWGNYNALFVSYRVNGWHGLTAVSNFTWGRALGTASMPQISNANTPLTPFDIGANYGAQYYDIKFLYNLSMYYQPPVFRGQHGVAGKILGGWVIAPLFTAQSGSPVAVSYSEGNCTACEAFGEVTPPAALSSTAEEAVGFMPYTGGTSVKYNQYGGAGSNLVFGANAVGTKLPSYGLNMFSNPAAVYSEFRTCVLGYDKSCGGFGDLRGLPTWNLDLSIVKDVTLYEGRAGAQIFIAITNAPNHFQAANPSLSLTSPTSFGQISSQANTPRNMEFGLRVHF
jgi:Carboxypeptidase regulatory-like domain